MSDLFYAFAVGSDKSNEKNLLLKLPPCVLRLLSQFVGRDTAVRKKHDLLAEPISTAAIEMWFKGNPRHYACFHISFWFQTDTHRYNFGPFGRLHNIHMNDWARMTEDLRLELLDSNNYYHREHEEIFNSRFIKLGWKNFDFRTDSHTDIEIESLFDESKIEYFS